jgi:hypothetical protein
MKRREFITFLGVAADVDEWTFLASWLNLSRREGSCGRRRAVPDSMLCASRRGIAWLGSPGVAFRT